MAHTTTAIAQTTTTAPTTTTPFNERAFMVQIESLAPDALINECGSQLNAFRHLSRSNREMMDADPTDADFTLACNENVAVMDRHLRKAKAMLVRLRDLGSHHEVLRALLEEMDALEAAKDAIAE
jgi:hypothetical protein